MRRLAIFFAATAATFSQVASAADMPIRAPAVAPIAPPITWTGFYVGGNIGYSWGRAQTDFSGNTVTTQTFNPGIPVTVTNFPASPFADSHKQSLNGVIGGGQIGLNYQFSPKWVVGFEFDFQGSGQRGSSTVSDPLAGAFCSGFSTVPPLCIAFVPASGSATTTLDAKIDWFGTARGRLGFLVTDQLLLYATGGLAYGEVKLSGLTNASLAGTIAGVPVQGGTSIAFGDSRTNVGWTVGGGIEGKFWGWLSPAWSWKAEYLYIDLGSLDTVTLRGPSTAVGNLFGNTTMTIGPLTTHTRFTDNIVRVGLNYKLF